jgi:dihydrolipoamide dehydrogenase
METSAAGVYAAGDVVGGYQLAHVARYGGEVAEKNIMGKDDRAGAGDVPKCVYSFPEIASVGMDEQGCDKPENHLVPKAPFAANPKARCTDSLAGFTKIVIERKSRMIAGVHMFGEGAMAGDIKGMMHPHPSLSERSTDALAGIEE